MRGILIGLIFLSLGKEALGMVDPFVNPIVIKEKLLKLKMEREAKVKRTPTKVRLFKPKLKKPFDQLSIQGIIGSNGKLYLVVLDPETGQTYFLKEGDPVAPDEKIAKITPSAIILWKYKRVKGKLVRKKIVLNVDTEDSNG